MKKKIIAVFTCICIIMSLMQMTVATADAENARYIMDAETLPDNKIAVLFIKGGTSSGGVITGGSLYYGVYDSSDNGWTEQPVGTSAPSAKEAALALSGSAAHIAYTTADDKIAYTYQSGSGWVDAVIIESNNCNDQQGVFYAPDIAVDEEGKAHITYFDTQGAVDDYYKRDDILYANNTTGSFVKSVIANCTGSYEAGEGGEFNEVAKPAKLAINNSGYNIVYRNHNSSRYGYGGWDHWYTSI